MASTLRIVLSAVLVVGCGQPGESGDLSDPPKVSTTEQAQTGQDGNFTVTAANTVLNQYSALNANATVGGTTLSVASVAALTSGAAQGNFGALAVGDELIVMQMRGALIDTSINSTYGTVSNLNGAGNYEFVNVAAINGNVITITTGDCGGLKNAYSTAGRSQVIRVPQIADLTINAGASVVPLAWDGFIGGVVAIHVGGTTTINGTINANALGFRGGAIDGGNANNNITGFVSATNSSGATKGEGIAGDATTYTGLAGQFLRGAPANGGGGGNGHTSGGGGGANEGATANYAGAGVFDTTVLGGALAWPLDPENANATATATGGGRGGYTQSTANLVATSVGPNNSSWLGDSRQTNGGRGGRPVQNDPANRLFLGGGGGAGDGDGNPEDAGAGGIGGGIVILVANTVTTTGTGSVTANGGTGGAATAGNDAGGGGGGAGGTIVIKANTLSGISASANGAAGGGALATGQTAHGPGGGGGGGFIATSGGTITTSATGALGGLSSSSALATEFPSNGASKGGSGNPAATVSALSGCFGDLTLALADSPDPVTSGANLTYTLTATNAGPGQVTGVSVVHTLQVADVSFVSATSADWTCNFVTPNVVCTRGTIAGATAAPAITVTVNVTTPNATTLNSSAVVRATTAETSSVNNTASTTTTVVAVNDPPVNTVPGPQATTEETNTSFAVSIADPDAGAAAVQTQLTVTNGTLTLNTTVGLSFSVGDGSNDSTMTFQGTISAINTAMASITYVPATNFAATATFTIVTNDLGNTGSGGPLTDTDTVQISVAGVNDPPVNTVPGAQAVSEDTPKAITGVSIADIDAGANQVEVQLSVTSGTLTIGTAGLTFVVGDGTADPTMTVRGTITALNTALASLTYTPPANTSGTFTLTLTTNDQGNTGAGGNLLDSDQIQLNVASSNDPPNAVNDARTVTEDSVGTLMNPLTNDTTAPDVGETLSITQVTQPANGSAAIVAGGTNITFTPTANFNGATSFTYTVSDGNGGLDTATISVTVSSVNDAPDAVNDSRTVNEDSGGTTITVLANDTITPDVGETLSVISTSQPAGGAVTIGGSGANVVFTPNANFNGVTTFTYTITDGNGGNDTGSVSVTVNPVNDDPNAVDDARTVAEDSAATTINVLSNDTIAPDVGESLTIISITQPTGGTAAIINGGNSVTFQPDGGFNGPTTFTYTISDGNGGSDTATVTVTVSGSNDPPTASNDTLVVDEDAAATVVDVVANDSIAPDVGETLTVTAVTQPANGTAAINGGGVNVTFTPAKDFFGATSFTYTVSDGNGGSDTATVNVTVNPLNDAPTANDDFLTVPQDAAATALDVLANDTFAPDTGETLTITQITQPADGVVALAGGGTGLTFDPTQGFNGLTTFTYTITDGTGLNDTATVTVGVGPDSDGDLLPDPYEVEIGTNPQDADTDDDGVKDGSEPDHAADSDGDGSINALDPDSDNDGLYDGTELGFSVAGAGTDPTKGHFIADADPATKTDPLDADSDDGTVIDGSEDINRNGKVDSGETNPNDGADDVGVVDTDGDGLSDGLETALGLDPDDADTDDDGVRDGDEPNFADDTDGDTLINAKDPDSDGDFLKDGTELGITTPDADTEVGAGNFVADADPGNTTNPLDNDTDDGGVIDGEEDANHDGKVDPGERDPNDPDDDNNSVGPMDDDGDGVRNDRDNCPGVSNPDQADLDNDDDGDACDDDDNGGGLNDDLHASGGGCSTGGEPAGLLLGLACALAFSRKRRAWLLGSAVALVLVPRVAEAQAPRDEPRDFSVERFQLASDRNGLLGVEWAESRGYLAFDVAVWFGYANDPLIVSNADGDRVGSLVADRTAGGLVASISPLEWVAFGLEMPVVLSQDRDKDMNVGALTTLRSGGSGSLRLIAKLTLLNQRQHGIGLAVVPALLLPTASSERAYLADEGVSFAPEVDISRSIDKVRLGANLGYRIRRETQMLDLRVDDEIFARVGVGYRMAPVGFDVMLSTAIGAKDRSANTGHFEALLGVNVKLGKTAVLFAAGGAGLHEGFGTPDYRFLGGVRLGSAERAEIAEAPPETPVDEVDSDGDGVMDWRDNCKDEPEDKDGFKDSDGCPELDNDNDKVPDATDKCRDEVGVVENNGCPGLDTDVDGIMDHLDKCPTEAEDFDNFEDEDGCPEPDNDKDGLSDGQDTCPTSNGPVENGGCPDADRDADGVADRIDNCPDEKGEQLNAGCTKKQLVAITPVKLATRETVEFNRAAIARKSLKLLDNIAAVLIAQPKLVIEVGVHTDNAGDDAANKTLTEKRADAVVAYLIKKGVDGQRLVPAGFGEEQPEGDNTTKEGRAQNRRVVFKIIGGTGPAKP